MNEQLFQFTLACIPILGTLVTAFVIPYIKENIDSLKLEKYQNWASLAVKCAEMLWTESGHGLDKKNYAVEFLNSLFNKNRIILTKRQISVLVESAVKEMKEVENSYVKHN